ncbi:ring finger [Fusarium austroafricanum]|uniref:Ring finger n=1 Tax=Fusarium austroafricanum TaxID=2364996 RepID=A0A8H4JUT4_9HYPO|nr:ring finger [Fusarium austroafricanum]
MSLCKVCEEALVLRLDHEDNVDDEAGASSSAGPSTASNLSVPDDLELPCSCHFHWQCLLDQSSDIALSLKCPSCSIYLPVNEEGPSVTNPFLSAPAGAAILVKYINEGGVQENLDILPSITEEAYLESHPEARPARALHVMCSEGDVGGIVELLGDASDEIGDMAAFITYQDPLADMKSGLHLAVENGQEESLWLLLWLCSTIPSSSFPDDARSVAEAVGIGRLSVANEKDIRGLRDNQGRTAADLAQQHQGQWGSILQTGLLSL